MNKRNKRKSMIDLNFGTFAWGGCVAIDIPLEYWDIPSSDFETGSNFSINREFVNIH